MRIIDLAQVKSTMKFEFDSLIGYVFVAIMAIWALDSIPANTDDWRWLIVCLAPIAVLLAIDGWSHFSKYRDQGSSNVRRP
jgi:hypothetical protein